MKKFLVVFGVLFIMSCSNKSNISYDDLFGKSFTLTNLYTDKKLTLLFADTNFVSGYSGINRFNSSFKLEGNNIIFENMISTLMSGSEEDMKIEDSYLKLLNSAKNISISENTLTIETTTGTNLIYEYSGDANIIM